MPGETYLSDLVGGRGGTKGEFSIPAGDYLTKISGIWGMSVPGRPKQEIVTIQFETKKGVKSPVFGGKHGKQEVDPFVLEAPEGQEIIGLFGLSYARDGMIGDETLIEKDIAAIFVICFRSRAS
ncbi:MULTISPECIES: jacalin-like lectin [Microcystis]|uniref:jacalin-like lectin n=1 Tax=Microcystis TaxID=1125 RepID=UPI001E441798|nr:jacalin-like lectin [Microcystis aeruginosa]UGS11452.1 hypothetical protein LRR78_20570 [Microcystis aeruginosa FACHB-905 = DIANCHI905]WKX63144.1 jacalin-like lectin [Microcystis aeruginosa PCC 7806]